MSRFPEMTLRIGHADAAVYPTLEMFSVGAHLFKPDDYQFFHVSARRHSFFDIMLAAERVQVEAAVLDSGFYISITVRMTSETSMGIGMLLDAVPMCNMYLRIIQRAIRRFHRARMSARRLALAMALHPRLGACSLLGELGQDILSLLK